MPERSGTGAGTDAVVTIEIPPPQGMGPASPQAPSSGPRSAEGWGSFWSGVFGGDFSDNDSWSKTGGQVLVGLVPWVGQAADARDTLAALDQVRQGRPGAWLGLLAAGVAWVPGAGDALKGAIQGGKKVAGDATEAALEQGAKRIGTDAADEAAETAARGTSPAGVAGTIPSKSVGGVEATQVGTRKLPEAENPWVKYQKHITGEPFEEVWKHNADKVYVDGRRAGYTVEAKWTGKNDAAWRSSPYNPRSDFYDQAKILEQARSLLDLNKATRGKGVAYAVSNPAARGHFEALFRRYFPGQPIKVWHVPGTGMK